VLPALITFAICRFVSARDPVRTRDPVEIVLKNPEPALIVPAEIVLALRFPRIPVAEEIEVAAPSVKVLMAPKFPWPDEVKLVNVLPALITFAICRFVSARAPVEIVLKNPEPALIVPAEIILAVRFPRIPVAEEIEVVTRTVAALIVPAEIVLTVSVPMILVAEEIEVAAPRVRVLTAPKFA
jgi:hypothetical protein